MSLTKALKEVIIRNAVVSALRRATPLAPLYRNNTNYSALAAGNRTMSAMFAVTVLHFVILGCILYPSVSVLSQQPVLSFTVTMMDLSSSPNSFSSASSPVNTLIEKSEPAKNINQNKSDKNLAQKKAVKVEVNPLPKTNAPLSHSSPSQTAVLAHITPAEFDAAYLQNPAPSYPPLSRRMGEQGNIMLRVYVNELGKAEIATIKKSSGFDRLDSAAVEAVKNWRFIAAKQHEQLVASWIQVPIKFILE